MVSLSARSFPLATPNCLSGLSLSRAGFPSLKNFPRDLSFSRTVEAIQGRGLSEFFFLKILKDQKRSEK